MNSSHTSTSVSRASAMFIYIYYPRLLAGQLYCQECHHNQTSVLPSRVVVALDCEQYLVCRMAYAFLYDFAPRPMLLVDTLVLNIQHVMSNIYIFELRIQHS